MPGATALSRTPEGPSSAAAIRSSCTSPAFVAAYTPWPGSTATARIELNPMMLPRPRSAMPAPNARTRSNDARRLRATTLSNSAAE